MCALSTGRMIVYFPITILYYNTHNIIVFVIVFAHREVPAHTYYVPTPVCMCTRRSSPSRIPRGQSRAVENRFLILRNRVIAKKKNEKIFKTETARSTQ